MGGYVAHFPKIERIHLHLFSLNAAQPEQVHSGCAAFGPEKAFWL